MSIHVALHHVTHYRYDRAVELGPQIVRLRPAAHSRTRILSYALKVSPDQHFINWQQDPQGNYLARLVFPEKTRELRIEVDLLAEMAVFNPFDFFLEPYAEKIPFAYAADERKELAPYLETLPLTPRFKGNVTARYEWDVGEMRAHVQGSVVNSGRFWTDLRSVERRIQGEVPGYTTLDLAAGVVTRSRPATT